MTGRRHFKAVSILSNLRIPAWGLAMLMMTLTVVASTTSPTMAQHAQAKPRLVIHEWGVITALAQPDGSLMPWSPMDGAWATPDFIESYGQPTVEGSARLDIPAIFFRTDAQMPLAMQMQWLKGRFHQGYPRASYQNRMLQWQDLTIMAGVNAPLPTDDTHSLYYQMRNTACAQVRVDHAGHKQFERFIHLRGVGQFDLPLQVRVDGQAYHMQPTDDHGKQITQVIAIERHHDQLGFAVLTLKPDQKTYPRPKLTAHIDLATARLRRLLNQQGLYPDEAAAVVRSHHAEWFEPGVRLIYLTPRPWVDQFLTATFTPAPSEHSRVYAVRVELLPDNHRDHLLEKLAKLAMEDATACRQFIQSGSLNRPWLKHLHATLEDPAMKDRIAAVLNHMEPHTEPSP